MITKYSEYDFMIIDECLLANTAIGGQRDLLELIEKDIEYIQQCSARSFKQKDGMNCACRHSGRCNSQQNYSQGLCDKNRLRKINKRKIKHITIVYDYDWDILICHPYAKKQKNRWSVSCEQWITFIRIVGLFLWNNQIL